jgi:hypothetical protein
MRVNFTERKLVVILFILVFITFALAQEDSKKMEKAYTGIQAKSASRLAAVSSLQVP